MYKVANKLATWYTIVEFMSEWITHIPWEKPQFHFYVELYTHAIIQVYHPADEDVYFFSWYLKNKTYILFYDVSKTKVHIKGHETAVSRARLQHCQRPPNDIMVIHYLLIKQVYRWKRSGIGSAGELQT